MKKKINIPDNWIEVKLIQFQEIIKLDNSDKNYAVELISILLDKDPEDIRSYDVNSANSIMRHLEWAMKSPLENEYKQDIVIDGVTYKLVENLNRFTSGDWWDMEEYLSDYAKNMHLLFALMYRPVGIEYSFELRKETAKIFQDKAMIGDIYGAIVFFSNVGKKSTLTIQDYLKNQFLKEKKN